MRPTPNKFSRALMRGSLDSLAKLQRAAFEQRTARDAPANMFQRFQADYGLLDDNPKRAMQRLAFPSVLTDQETLRSHSQANWLNLSQRLRYGVAAFIEAARKLDVPLFAFRAWDQDHPAHWAGNCVLVHHAVFGQALSPGETTALRILCERIAHNKGIALKFNRMLITDPFGCTHGPFLPGKLSRTPRSLLRTRG